MRRNEKILVSIVWSVGADLIYSLDWDLSILAVGIRSTFESFTSKSKKSEKREEEERKGDERGRGRYYGKGLRREEEEGDIISKRG